MLQTKNDGKMVLVIDYFIILRDSLALYPSPTPIYTIFKIKKRFKYFKIIKKK